MLGISLFVLGIVSFIVYTSFINRDFVAKRKKFFPCKSFKNDDNFKASVFGLYGNICAYVGISAEHLNTEPLESLPIIYKNLFNDDLNQKELGKLSYFFSLGLSQVSLISRHLQYFKNFCNQDKSPIYEDVLKELFVNLAFLNYVLHRNTVNAYLADCVIYVCSQTRHNKSNSISFDTYSFPETETINLLNRALNRSEVQSYDDVCKRIYRYIKEGYRYSDKSTWPMSEDAFDYVNTKSASERSFSKSTIYSNKSIKKDDSYQQTRNAFKADLKNSENFNGSFSENSNVYHTPQSQVKEPRQTDLFDDLNFETEKDICSGFSFNRNAQVNRSFANQNNITGREGYVFNEQGGTNGVNERIKRTFTQSNSSYNTGKEGFVHREEIKEEIENDTLYTSTKTSLDLNIGKESTGTKRRYTRKKTTTSSQTRKPRSTKKKCPKEYTILGATPENTFEEIRRKYHQLVRSLHPDMQGKITARQRNSLNKKLSKINLAFEAIKKQDQERNRSQNPTP